MGQLDRAAETLVLLRVVVLEPDLELDGLSEFPVLLLGISHHLGDGLLEGLGRQLTAKQSMPSKLDGKIYHDHTSDELLLLHLKAADIQMIILV
jgi:hypothetical protein